MKGMTNLQFLYQNAKYSETYLDNMYRKKLDTGKYVIDDKLDRLKDYNEIMSLQITKQTTKKKIDYYINECRKNQNYLGKFLLLTIAFIIYSLVAFNLNNNISLKSLNSIGIYVTFIMMMSMYKYTLVFKVEF